MSTVAELLDAIDDELDLHLNVDEGTKRKVLRWMNSIYNEVVTASEYPWRKKSAHLTTVGPASGTTNLTYGEAVFHGGTLSGWSPLHGLGYLSVPSMPAVYPINAATSYLYTLGQEWQGTTGAYSVTMYAPRYRIQTSYTYGAFTYVPLREDWITGIYNLNDDTPLPRIHPANFQDYISYSMRNPAQPTCWYTEGADSDHNVYICFSPVPDGVYTYLVSYLLGASTLTADTTSTILPSEVETDIFVNGVAMLHAINRKEMEGLQMYGSRFKHILDTLMARTAKNPGASQRVMGYIARRSGVWDKELPLTLPESTWST